MSDDEIRKEMDYLYEKKQRYGWNEKDVVMYKHYGSLLGDSWDDEMPPTY